ncbi:MAG: acetyl-CoA C-acyltransferase FadI [Planctomycetes bacterium]|nr:acetyl-CoA C-acyltransferase FadI [Planctomycetota bacterium]
MSDPRRIAIVAGCRTPFARSGTSLRNVSAVELGRSAVVELLNRTELDPGLVDETIFGQVIPSIKTPNVAREIALGAGIPPRAPSFTVNRACASSAQAITAGAESIRSGHADVIVAGGVETLSDVPILHSRRMRDRMVAMSKARSWKAKARMLLGVRARDLVPEEPAIAEPSTGLSMGQSAEKMARENGITRQAQDELACRSHVRAAAATADGRLGSEICAVLPPPAYSQPATEDNFIRADTTLEALAKLPPAFDRKNGTVTAGNSSGLTDGGAAVLLMADEKARALGYKPLGYLRSYAYAALDPREQLLMGPAYAIPKALDRASLTLREIDLVEMHEAFAAQVLSTLQALGSDAFAREKLGRSAPVGEIDPERLNACGGSIAIGHPFGATGARLVTTLLNELARRHAWFGLVSICAAGGMGVAMVLEREE